MTNKGDGPLAKLEKAKFLINISKALKEYAGKLVTQGQEQMREELEFLDEQEVTQPTASQQANVMLPTEKEQDDDAAAVEKNIAQVPNKDQRSAKQAPVEKQIIRVQPMSEKTATPKEPQALEEYETEAESSSDVQSDDESESESDSESDEYDTSSEEEEEYASDDDHDEYDEPLKEKNESHQRTVLLPKKAKIEQDARLQLQRDEHRYETDHGRHSRY